MTEEDPHKLPLRATTRALPIALLRARETVMEPIRSMLMDIGVTEQQWRVLRVLAEYSVLDPTEIAEKSCLLMPSLTRMLKSLEQAGWITRRKDEKDKRRFWFSLTPAGEALVAEHIPASNQVYAEIERLYGAEKLETLLDLLEELSALSLTTNHK